MTYPSTRSAQTSTDPADTAHLSEGQRITLDEISVHLSAVSVWLRQLSRAAETPAAPVELSDFITSWERTAKDLAHYATKTAELSAIVEGDAPLSATFYGGKPWGKTAAGNAPDEYGPPPVIPSLNQIWHLRAQAENHPDEPTVTYREAVGDIEGFESRHAAARRSAEAAAALFEATRATVCPRCGAGPGAWCRTSTGRVAELFHKPREAAAKTAMNGGK